MYVNINLQIYKEDTSDGIVQVNPSPIMDKIGFGGGAAMSYSMVEFDVWTELMDNEELLKEQYDVVKIQPVDMFSFTRTR